MENGGRGSIFRGLTSFPRRVLAECRPEILELKMEHGKWKMDVGARFTMPACCR